MSLSDRLSARLLDLKERLRRLEATIEDLRKAAAESSTVFARWEYQQLEKELHTECDKARRRIKRLEELRASMGETI